MPNLIELKNLCKFYNADREDMCVRALDNVNLSVRRGEYIAIIGHSGSGKSTLMNLLGFLDSPTSGEYYLEGQDVSRLSDDELSDIRNIKIGFIFQGFNLIPSYNAMENVELPLVYRGIGRRRRSELARRSLEAVGLGKRLTHRPTEMSGGQCQRVAIARAIAADPAIILADEPTGNLDSTSTKEICALLEQLNRAGHTLIMITHDDELAARASRVIKIADGRITEDKLNAL